MEKKVHKRKFMKTADDDDDDNNDKSGNGNDFQLK